MVKHVIYWRHDVITDEEATYKNTKCQSMAMYGPNDERVHKGRIIEHPQSQGIQGTGQ